ncbi:hypothetical protein GVN21_06045 [Caulobacter sp. SLTY]|uniref:hypothetical protein n=1 Tax=Caulobacter sp. SLTY TaxID=2683262 RepID=UPI00141301A5|nr:hypothetical protein [Caulobacter sp. SLTY]NBB14924.1 hypothetical protein [Caulobacter sp. SLTY]
MNRQTSAGRVAAAIAVGSLIGPFCVLMIVGLVGPPTETWEEWLFLLLLSLILGSPIAAAAITVLFGPLWIIHHRRRGRLGAFLLLATLAAFVMASMIALYLLSLSGPSEPLVAIGIILALTAAGLPTGAIVWCIAYGLGSDDPQPPARG